MADIKPPAATIADTEVPADSVTYILSKLYAKVILILVSSG